MRISIASPCALSALATATIVAGCSNGGSQSGFNPSAPTQKSVAYLKSHAHPLNCPPKAPHVWGDDLNGNTVSGYGAPTPAAACILLTGTGVSPTPSFNSPEALATDHNGNLFVADALNGMVDEFTKKGAYVTSFSTNSMTPHGVCVSKPYGQATTEVLGVAGSGITGPSVQFFDVATPPNPIESGTGGNIVWGGDCAFDRQGNFFVDGFDSNANFWIEWATVEALQLGTRPVPLTVATNVGNAFWAGMYVRKDTPKVLSVWNQGFNTTTQDVDNFTITYSGANTTGLGTTLAPYTFSSWPNSSGFLDFEQCAPDRNGYTYFSDNYANEILYGPSNGGALSVYQPLSSAYGVATHPTGQY